MRFGNLALIIVVAYGFCLLFIREQDRRFNIGIREGNRQINAQGYNGIPGEWDEKTLRYKPSPNQR